MRHVQKIAVIFASIVAALFVLTADAQRITGAVGVHNHSSAVQGGGALNLSGELASTRACATNYLRVSPNKCLWNFATGGLPAGITLPTAGTCTAITTPSPNAKGLILRMANGVMTQNAVALRQSNGLLSGENTCANVDFTWNFQAREQVAAPATLLAESTTADIVIRLTVQGGNASGQMLTHSNQASTVSVWGYHD